MNFINIGTNELNEEYFYEIVNSDKVVKPAGGLWTSPYYGPTFIEWIDYIVKKPLYYMRYMDKLDPFKMDGAVVTLSDDAKVLNLTDSDGLEELEKKYFLDFEKLASDYDAILVDLYFLYSAKTIHNRDYERLYSVKTLNIFNFSKIKGYRKALVELEPFDYTYSNMEEIWYDTKVNDEELKPMGMSKEYQEFLGISYEKLKDFVFHLRLKYPDISSTKMVSLIKEELERVIGEELLLYSKDKNMDQDRLALSLAIRTLRNVK